MDDDYKIRPFTMIIPKTNAYVKNQDGESKWMYFLIEDDELLEKYNDIYNKVSSFIEMKLHREPICCKKILKT